MPCCGFSLTLRDLGPGLTRAASRWLETAEMSLYRDRQDAGRQLARQLEHYADQPNTLVLGLPRGGVVPAAEVARALRAPLDIVVVRKLGLPGHEEYAMGAIAAVAGTASRAGQAGTHAGSPAGTVRVMNPLPGLRIAPEALAAVLQREQTELARREQLYRAGLPPLAVAGRTVLLIDDGLATGSTLHAAVQALRQQHVARLVVAVPVGACDSCARLAREVDELVCPAMPEPFHALSLYYRHFDQTPDEQVVTLLQRAWHEHAARPPHPTQKLT